jgi:hypothetical protein
MDVSKTRIHDLLTARPAAIPPSGEYPRCGQNHGDWRFPAAVGRRRHRPDRNRRLSWTLDDQPGSPSVYVTWELRRASDGTIIRLNVDEPWPLAGITEDFGSAWLAVLCGLVKHR